MGVDDEEMPLQIRPAGAERDRIAELVDVARYVRVGDDRKLMLYLLSSLLTDCDFLILRDIAACQSHARSESQPTFHEESGWQIVFRPHVRDLIMIEA